MLKDCKPGPVKSNFNEKIAIDYAKEFIVPYYSTFKCLIWNQKIRHRAVRYLRKHCQSEKHVLLSKINGRDFTLI